jgi:excisionase family DNA binding protein
MSAPRSAKRTPHASNQVARLALSPDEAAAALGVSRDYFDEWIASELRIVRRGRRKLVPVREIERWLERAAALPLAGEA